METFTVNCDTVLQVLAQVEFAIRRMRAKNIKIYEGIDSLYVVEYLIPFKL